MTFVQRYSSSHQSQGEMQIQKEFLHSISVHLLFQEAQFSPFNIKITSFVTNMYILTTCNSIILIRLHFNKNNISKKCSCWTCIDLAGFELHLVLYQTLKKATCL